MRMSWRATDHSSGFMRRGPHGRKRGVHRGSPCLRQRQQIADVGQAQAQRAAVANEAQPGQGIFAIEPIATGARRSVVARRLRYQTDLFAVADALGGDAAGFGGLADR